MRGGKGGGMKEQRASTAELHRALYRKPGKRKLDLETQIQAGVLDWLNTVPNCKAWRQNTGAREWIDSDGKKRLVKFGQVGQADVTGLVCGVRLEVEVKRPGEKPSDEQYAWLWFIESHGGIAFWCDSLDVCQRRLREAFERRAWTWRRQWEV